jgi:DNA-3-methyladenine glycosylase II
MESLLSPGKNICALCISLASFALVLVLDLELTDDCVPVKPVCYRQNMPRPLSSPRPPRYDASKAISDLSFADPKLGKLIERAGPFTMRVASAQSPFEALVESIIYQQLHGKAAATIHRRMIESFAPAMTLEAAGTGAHPTPQQLLECPNEQLRAAGLSKNKMLALRDLAAKTIDGTVPDLKHIRRMSDEAIIEHLTQVRGIGRWTVEMLLIFRLGRPNVLPVDDYGVRKGFALTFGKLKPTDKVTPMDLPKPDEMHRRAKKWQPWCSVASWYLWRACDLAKPKT